MSRIGKAPISIPDDVDVTIDGSDVTVKGPKGTLSNSFSPDMEITRENGTIVVKRPTDKGEHRSLHGLTRSLIANMVEGVTQGFKRELEINGVGYRANLKGKSLDLAVGLSHPVTIEPEPDTEFEVPKQTQVIIKGIDKQVVGQLAARIRSIRPPEPYKGKGIKYVEEHIRRKVGKRA
ncbi:50S ribosomal protein L6 [bacterium BMS3Abin01]|nr:50S ribosomal protein L6 [bacterium BMS3Abin01]HDZ59782.1 50S ribosomal protein L6 [Actinomycetota bacterium]